MEKKQTISVDAKETVFIEADRLVLRQAIINLLDNAIKYSPEGSSISMRTMNGGSFQILEIMDNGPGIAPEHLDRVFDRFYRIDKDRSRRSGGSGLGLSISRWAVEAHGGRIELESEVGKGSTFRIVLPDKYHSCGSKGGQKERCRALTPVPG